MEQQVMSPDQVRLAITLNNRVELLRAQVEFGDALYVLSFSLGYSAVLLEDQSEDDDPKSEDDDEPADSGTSLTDRRKDLNDFERTSSNRLKVVLVGKLNAGKTTLARSEPLPTAEERTVGVEIRYVQLGAGPVKEGSTVYLVTPFVGGERGIIDMFEWVETNVETPASEDVIRPLLRQYLDDIIEGLNYLHKRGVLHRDTKSHNVLLHAGGAKISDFGLAHVCSTIGPNAGTGSFVGGKGNFLDEGEMLYERSLGVNEKAFEPDHHLVAESLTSRVVLLEDQGNYDEAGELYERSMAIREKALGPDDPAVATALNNWAGLLKAQVYSDAKGGGVPMSAPETVVAIDFGTTRSAWAYKVSGQADGKILVKIPGSAVTAPSATAKTETVALIGGRGRGDLIKFGPTALEQYAASDHAEDLALFRWFKLGLCESKPGETTAGSVMTSSTGGGHTVPLLGVMKASLRYFKGDILGFLSRIAGRKVQANSVNWVLTVPAIYDDFAKRFMRQAAFEAGMIDTINSTRLRLCLEPEAAVLSAITKDNPLTCEEEGKNMMIIDCGGGTVDITAHQIVSVEPLKLEEVAAPNGGKFGSTRVDEAFKGWLRTFLGEWFKEIEATGTLVSIMLTWERSKATFEGEDSTTALLLKLTDLAELGMTREHLEGKYEGALFERCQAMEQKVLSPDHVRLAITLNNRAELLRAQGKYVEAGQIYELLRPVESFLVTNTDSLPTAGGVISQRAWTSVVPRRALAIRESTLILSLLEHVTYAQFLFEIFRLVEYAFDQYRQNVLRRELRCIARLQRSRPFSDRGTSGSRFSPMVGMIAAAGLVPGVAAMGETFGERLESTVSEILVWLGLAPRSVQLVAIVLAGVSVYNSIKISIREIKAGNAELAAAKRESRAAQQAAIARRQGTHVGRSRDNAAPRLSRRFDAAAVDEVSVF